MRDAISDLISLAEGAKAARDLATKRDSLEQACREAEVKLSTARTQLVAAEAGYSKVLAAQNEYVEGVKGQCAAIEAAARAEAAKTRDQAERWASSLRSGVNAEVDELRKKSDMLREKVGELEDREAHLGQAVAKLHAELDSIRSRLLG